MVASGEANSALFTPSGFRVREQAAHRDSSVSDLGREESSAMQHCQDFNPAGRRLVDETVRIDKNFSLCWTSKFGNHSSLFREIAQLFRALDDLAGKLLGEEPGVASNVIMDLPQIQLGWLGPLHHDSISFSNSATVDSSLRIAAC